MLSTSNKDLAGEIVYLNLDVQQLTLLSNIKKGVTWHFLKMLSPVDKIDPQGTSSKYEFWTW